MIYETFESECQKAQPGMVSPRIKDWRSMVDCVMINADYDGEVFNVPPSDVPETKDAEETTVAVKIIDMLEEVLDVFHFCGPSFYSASPLRGSVLWCLLSRGLLRAPRATSAAALSGLKATTNLRLLLQEHFGFGSPLRAETGSDVARGKRIGSSLVLPNNPNA
jgi:hypothetical protein